MHTRSAAYCMLPTLSMKFIADVMLGRLAKRLRLLGFDVLYDRSLEDNELIRLALEQDRIILTRDTGLASRPLAKANIFISSDRVGEQVREVLDRSSKKPPPGSKGGTGRSKSALKPAPLTRCSVCNTPLTAVPKREVKDLVPEHIYAVKKTFSRCTGCGRIYWRGSHVRRIGTNGRKNNRRPPR